MLGWPILLTARASSTNRRTSSGLRGDVRRQHLDRDALADDGLDGRVDRAHPALADLAQDAVLADLHPLGQIAGAGGAAVPPVDRRDRGCRRSWPGYRLRRRVTMTAARTSSAARPLGRRLPPIAQPQPPPPPPPPPPGPPPPSRSRRPGVPPPRAAATAAAAARAAAVPPAARRPAVQVLVKIGAARDRVRRLAGARATRSGSSSGPGSPCSSCRGRRSRWCRRSSSSSGIWLQRPTPSQALQVPQAVPAAG